VIVVMGIDPGLASTGFGVVGVAGGRMRAIDGGVVESPSDAPAADRLVRIHSSLEQLLAWHSPAAVALEDLYFGKNVRSAIAAKGQVQQMVGTLLGLPRPPSSDHAADALAVAVCHAAHAGASRAARRALVGAPS
jgi:crossover junction endodeoxyribonuclease RuvC